MYRPDPERVAIDRQPGDRGVSEAGVDDRLDRPPRPVEAEQAAVRAVAFGEATTESEPDRVVAGRPRGDEFAHRRWLVGLELRGLLQHRERGGSRARDERMHVSVA